MEHDALNNLVDSLAVLPDSDRLFNPYTSQDDPGASIRRENLLRYLADMRLRRPRMLLLFEAPGYRGCAMSGIPVTSERIMLKGIEKWGLFGEGYRATSGHPQGVAEMTATILWGALAEHVEHPPLIWNTVPLHPHRTGQPQSNRPPTRAETRLGLPFIEMVMGVFSFEVIGAVGRVAQRALDGMGCRAIPLRHPSQGGKAAFIRGLAEIAVLNNR
ncbi:MAG: uracil-DNA glycosylase [Anaerolineae bacterium]|nr:uracil-DNA glycosylase [Anaerolineae bacterium]